MLRKLAIKRLTASDLTFFEWHFRNEPAGNQKAINLNANVFVQELYPSLPLIAQAASGRLAIDLFLYGPGLQGEYNLQRKIVKSGAYKNWRLDGEFIFNPADMPERFNPLKPGDLVILDFLGDLQPTSARAVFISKSIPEDKGLHALIEKALGERSMASWTVSELAELIERAAPPDAHPVNELVLDSALEDAALKGVQGTTRLLRRRSGRRLSRQDLKAALEKAEDTGWRGEGFVNAYLEKLRRENRISAFEWVSYENAIATNDFTVHVDGKNSLLIDAKSTGGDFDCPVHISASELLAMSESALRYDMYRVFEMGESNATIRIAEDLGPLAKEILKAFEGLPKGVTPDSVSVKPSTLTFSDGIQITLPDEPEEE